MCSVYVYTTGFYTACVCVCLCVNRMSKWSMRRSLLVFRKQLMGSHASSRLFGDNCRQPKMRFVIIPLINYFTCLSLYLSFSVMSVASWQQHRLISSVRGKICWTVYDTLTRRWDFRAYWWTHSFQNITR